MRGPGPPALGRGVVVDAGQPAPSGWEGAVRVALDAEALRDPSALVEALHLAWVGRVPVVIELGVDPAEFREPRSFPGEAWRLGAGFDAWSDRLHFLVWANTYDARGRPEPVWWWGRKAAHLAGVAATGPDEPGDIRLPDGGPAWVDGGPRAGFELAAAGGLRVVHRESVEAGTLAPVPPPVAPGDDLAPDQLAAVGHTSGPARIIAPAGSGKTRVLTARLRHLLVDRGYERDGVLAVAYNKKAQQEMETRTVDVRPRIQTLNAAGYRLLAQARGAAPRVLDEREVRRLVERLVPIRRQRANTDPIGPYVEALGAVRLGLRDPEEIEAWRDDVPGLADAFDPYREALREAGAVDFDEQVYGAVELLLADGALRRRAQAGCRHLLVDEFQDLTPAHMLFLRLLATPQLDVFGVGDDDQVIYGHAGADPAFLIGFGGLFPGAADHPLEINYRCPVAVVEQAANLLTHNRRRVSKTLRPGPSAVAGADAARVIEHPPAGGAGALVGVIRGWIDAGVRPADIAVLARVNALLLAPQVALLEAGLPVVSALDLDVLGRTGLRAALAYLRIAAAGPDRIAADDVLEILRRPSRGLPQWFGDRIRRRSFWSVKALGQIADQVPEKEAPKAAWLASDLGSLVRSARRPGATTRSVLSVVTDQIGLGGAMSLLDSSRGGEGSSHLDDLDALAQVASLHPDLATFEEWLRGRLARPDLEAPAGIVLSTVHRVKGMEWPRVAVFGVNAGILPHRLAEDEEEERRVLHVAITRCRQQVVLLADAARPSPLLGELFAPAPAPKPAPAPAGLPATPSGLPAKAGAGGEALAARPAGSTAGRPRGRRTATPAAAVDPVVEQALRTWRTERARRDKMAPYIILHDATLLGIAAARPATLAALRRVDGIGPAKLELYGEEILAVLAGVDDRVGAP